MREIVTFARAKGKALYAFDALAIRVAKNTPPLEVEHVPRIDALSSMQLVQIILTHRRRLASIVLLAGLALLAVQFWPQFPRETELDLVLGPEHRQVVEVRLAYLQSDEEIRGVTFRFPNGAPINVKHRIDLPSGLYRIAIERRFHSGEPEKTIRAFTVPAAGVVRVQAY